MEGVKRYCCQRMLLGYVDTVTARLAYVHEVHDPPSVPERVFAGVD